MTRENRVQFLCESPPISAVIAQAGWTEAQLLGLVAEFNERVPARELADFVSAWDTFLRRKFIDGAFMPAEGNS